VTLKILPSKLRIEYSRDNSELDDSKLRPPHGDFAHNWNGYISAVHIDVKIPSEHTICGKTYAGEYQIYFYHPDRKQPIVQSVLIDVHPNERHHKHFQKVLNEWQALYDERAMECMDQDREERKLEETFVRRMENFMATSLDSHEISPRDSGDRGESKWSSTTSDQSTMLDEPRGDSARFQNVLRKVKDRASHPLFKEEYERLNLSANTSNTVGAKEQVKPASYLRRRAADTSDTIEGGSAMSTGSRVDDCQDFRESFLLEGANITCEDIQPSSSTYSHCKSVGTVKTLCPVACGVCQHSSSIINGTAVTDQPPPSASPTSPPTSRVESTDPTSPPSSRSNSSPPSPIPTNPPPSSVKWDPFQPRIVNSIYFYGYGGSLTEPPCSEWVSWRVLDTPMQISSAQLNQMSNILFGHLDQDCKRNNVQWQNSVARPTQSLNDRELWQCTRDDYESDVEKNGIPSNDN
jgi:carbonic anhydrase